MKRVLAFSGSNHSKSINQQLIRYTSKLVQEYPVTIIDIRSFIVPIYSIDMDPETIPKDILTLIEQIKEHDAFIISSPEHNGGTPAFFKNILDWLTRRSSSLFESKPLLLMSTSPGKRGGEKNRMYLEGFFPRLGANIISTFSLPSFKQNMVDEELNEDMKASLVKAVKILEKTLSNNQ